MRSPNWGRGREKGLIAIIRNGRCYPHQRQTIALLYTGAARRLLDAAVEENLTYTWSVISQPGGANATFDSVNGTNDGKQTIVTFDTLGEHTFHDRRR